MSYQDEIEKLESRIETLEQQKTIPTTPKLMNMRAYIEKIIKTFGLSETDTINDLLEKLSEKQEQYEAIEKEKAELLKVGTPRSEKECKNRGGTWDPKNMTCKLPEKETLESIAILPSSRPSETSGERRAKYFAKKLLGDKE